MNNKEYEYAGFWVRVGATLIDTLLLAIIILPLTMIIYGNYWESNKIILGPAHFLINYILPFLVVVLFWFYKSATPGKMLLEMKIVNANDGSGLSIGQSIGRYFAYLPALLVLGVGIFWVAFDERKQGWHDKLAGTVVIKKKKTTKAVEFKS